VRKTDREREKERERERMGWLMRWINIRWRSSHKERKRKMPLKLQ
jgi:hypothetical protein